MESIAQLEAQLRSLLRGQFSSLTISFNDHAVNYTDAASAIGILDMMDHGEWVSEDEKRRAIETNSVWQIQWYPETPVGFNCLIASSLEVLIAALPRRPKESQ